MLLGSYTCYYTCRITTNFHLQGAALQKEVRGVRQILATMLEEVTELELSISELVLTNSSINSRDLVETEIARIRSKAVGLPEKLFGLQQTLDTWTDTTESGTVRQT